MEPAEEQICLQNVFFINQLILSIGHWGPISCVYHVMEEQLGKDSLAARLAIHPHELWISWLTQWWPIWNPPLGPPLSEAGYVDVTLHPMLHSAAIAYGCFLLLLSAWC